MKTDSGSNLFVSSDCIKDTNTSIEGLRYDSNLLLRSNETVGIKNPPPVQRVDYAANLNDFADAVKKFIDSFPVGIKVLFQAKIYNLKLMNDYRETKKEFEPLKKDEELSSLNRIDKILEKEVEKMIQETQKRVNGHL